MAKKKLTYEELEEENQELLDEITELERQLDICGDEIADADDVAIKLRKKIESIIKIANK